MDTTPFNEQVIPCADCAALTTENAQLKAAIEMVKAICEDKSCGAVGTIKELREYLSTRTPSSSLAAHDAEVLRRAAKRHPLAAGPLEYDAARIEKGVAPFSKPVPYTDAVAGLGCKVSTEVKR
jgi:hypothetical protein